MKLSQVVKLTTYLQTDDSLDVTQDCLALLKILKLEGKCKPLKTAFADIRKIIAEA